MLYEVHGGASWSFMFTGSQLFTCSKIWLWLCLIQTAKICIVIHFKSPRALKEISSVFLGIREAPLPFFKNTHSDPHSDPYGWPSIGGMRKVPSVPEAAGLGSEISVSAAQPENMEVRSPVNKASTESQPFLSVLVVFCITLALISCQNKQRGAQWV